MKPASGCVADGLMNRNLTLIQPATDLVDTVIAIAYTNVH